MNGHNMLEKNKLMNDHNMLENKIDERS